MRELRTTAELQARGISRDRVRWAIKTGRWTVIIRGVYGRGPEKPSKLDVGRGTALVTNGVAVGCLSAALHNFDGVKVGGVEVIVPRSSNAERPGVKRRTLMPTETVILGQVRCLTAADTLLELAARLDDTHWEQAVEFCLRKHFVTCDQLELWSRSNRRARRVLQRRGGLEVAHTDSLLETLAVQLLRLAGLPARLLADLITAALIVW